MDGFIYSLLNDNKADILEDEEGAHVLAVALITGAEIAHQEHINNHLFNRLYLCCPQLDPNMREIHPGKCCMRVSVTALSSLPWD
jgi:hypothetical protein